MTRKRNLDELRQQRRKLHRGRNVTTRQKGECKKKERFNRATIQVECNAKSVREGTKSQKKQN